MILAVAMATEEAKYILTTFLLVLSGTDHCVKVSSNSETMRAEFFWWLQRIMSPLRRGGGHIVFGVDPVGVGVVSVGVGVGGVGVAFCLHYIS